MGKIELPQQMVLNKLDIYIQKIKPNPYIIAYIKINSKWVEDLSVWSETVRLLKENVRINRHDLGMGKAFLDKRPKE